LTEDLELLRIGGHLMSEVERMVQVGKRFLLAGVPAADGKAGSTRLDGGGVPGLDGRPVEMAGRLGFSLG
jgi:hypothetical protein